MGVVSCLLLGVKFVSINDFVVVIPATGADVVEGVKNDGADGNGVGKSLDVTGNVIFVMTPLMKPFDLSLPSDGVVPFVCLR